MHVSRGTGITAHGPSTCGGCRQHLPQELLLWRVFKAAGHRESGAGRPCVLAKEHLGTDGWTDRRIFEEPHPQ